MDRSLQSLGTTGEFLPSANPDQKHQAQPETFGIDKKNNFLNKRQVAAPDKKILERVANFSASIALVRDCPGGVRELTVEHANGVMHLTLPAYQTPGSR